jgi:hypothetical protein
MWPKKTVQILRNVRTAGGPRATVLLVELVIRVVQTASPLSMVEARAA